MKPLQDYSHIRGFCYGWQKTKPEDHAREMGYAQKLNLNSTRIWLWYREYTKNPDAYVASLKTFIRTAWEKGISTMPILFNANLVDPAILDDAWRETGRAYVQHIVEALKNEEGVIMWDIMNEPSYNEYILKAEGAEQEARKENVWNFVRYFSKYVRELDPDNAITIGHTFITDVEPTVDCVDVISFHDYQDTAASINRNYDLAEELSKKYHKPVMNTELCCLCRGNPYDLALQICQERNMGWYLFELMIKDHWSDVHGIFYPDGTVRDPAIVAAVMGIFRNRDPHTHIKANANREGHVEKAIEKLKAAMQDDRESFVHKSADIGQILEAAEKCVNYLECCELVPMNDPPSLQLRRFREQENPNLDEVRAWAYGLAMQLKKDCKIF